MFKYVLLFATDTIGCFIWSSNNPEKGMAILKFLYKVAINIIEGLIN